MLAKSPGLIGEAEYTLGRPRMSIPSEIKKRASIEGLRLRAYFSPPYRAPNFGPSSRREPGPWLSRSRNVAGSVYSLKSSQSGRILEKRLNRSASQLIGGDRQLGWRKKLAAPYGCRDRHRVPWEACLFEGLARRRCGAGGDEHTNRCEPARFTAEKQAQSPWLTGDFPRATAQCLRTDLFGWMAPSRLPGWPLERHNRIGGEPWSQSSTLNFH